MRSLHLDFSFLAENQAQKEITVNTALEKIDVLLNSGIQSIQSSPAFNPTSGDVYIVGISATDDWEGQENNIAYFNSSNQWDFIIPKEGMSVFVLSTSSFYAYTVNGGWTEINSTINNGTGGDGGGSGSNNSGATIYSSIFNPTTIQRNVVRAICNTQPTNNDNEELILDGYFVTNGVAVNDLPAKISFYALTGNFNLVTYEVIGVDENGTEITELLSIAPSQRIDTNNFFSTVTRINIESFSGTSFSDIRVGVSDRFLNITNTNQVIHIGSNVEINIDILDTQSFEVMIIQNQGGGENVTWRNEEITWANDSSLITSDDAYTLYKFINNGSQLLGLKIGAGAIDVPPIEDIDG